MSVIDTRTNRVTTTILVGNDPWWVTLDPQTGTAYVTDSDDGTVSVLQAP